MKLTEKIRYAILGVLRAVAQVSPQEVSPRWIRGIAYILFPSRLFFVLRGVFIFDPSNNCIYYRGYPVSLDVLDSIFFYSKGQLWHTFQVDEANKQIIISSMEPVPKNTNAQPTYLQ